MHQFENGPQFFLSSLMTLFTNSCPLSDLSMFGAPFVERNIPNKAVAASTADFLSKAEDGEGFSNYINIYGTG